MQKEIETTSQTNQLNSEILQLKSTLRDQNEKILKLDGEIVTLRKDCLTSAGNLANLKEQQRYLVLEKHEVEKNLEEANKWRSDYLLLEKKKSEEIGKLNEEITRLEHHSLTHQDDLKNLNEAQSLLFREKLEETRQLEVSIQERDRWNSD